RPLHSFPTRRSSDLILKNFGVPIVAAINRFPDDSESELKRLAAYCAERGVESALSEGFAKGGPGAKGLAEKLVETIEKTLSPAEIGRAHVLTPVTVR